MGQGGSTMLPIKILRHGFAFVPLGRSALLAPDRATFW